MKDIWGKYKIYIIIAGYMVAAGLIIYFGAVSFVKAIKSQSDQIQEKIIDNQIEKSRLSKIPDMEKAYADFENKKDSVEVILDPSGEVDFIKKLESVADETGNAISFKIDESGNALSKKPTSQVKKKNEEERIVDGLRYTDYISIQITLQGNYSGLVNFIRKLENLRYYVNVISLNIGKEKREENNSGAGGSSQAGDVFLATGQNPAGSSASAPKEQEILKSMLQVVVYKK